MTNNDDAEEVGHHQDRYENLDVDGHPAPVSCYEDLNPADGIVGPDEKATCWWASRSRETQAVTSSFV